jgi:hypothetical protein
MQFVHLMTDQYEMPLEWEVNDPIMWLLGRGKELERACDFATAIKYYFAGRMFFARLHASPLLKNLFFEHLPRSTTEENARSLLKKRKKIEEEFKTLYTNLLPMTNAEVRICFPALNTHIADVLDLES